MTDRVYDHLIEQAGWNEGLGSPFTAAILLKMAEDLKAGGPVHTLTHDWSGSPRKDALGLRILGALHYAVLTGRAPDLAASFPSSQGEGSIDTVWPIARDWLSANFVQVQEFIKSPPQTNETRRAIALLPGFLELAARFDMPMHLLELGASAGLNQNWDRFNYETADWQRAGTSQVTIKTDWTGPAPKYLTAEPRIASRAACDLSPLDVSDPSQALKLKSYTWADQQDRLSRLDAAMALARETQVKVDRADAIPWLKHKLANRPATGLTVVYHSVFLIYPSREEIAEIMHLIATAGAQATDIAPLAWLCYESEALFDGDKASPLMYTRLQTWPGGDARELVRSNGHVTKVEALA